MLQRFPGPLLALFLRKALVLRPEADVAYHIHLEKLVLRILKHQPHPGAQLPHVISVFVNVLSFVEDSSGRRTDQPVQVLDQRGLPGTGMPDDPHELSLRDLEAHIFKCVLLIGRTRTVYITYMF